jgi:hypothetical protein
MKKFFSGSKGKILGILLSVVLLIAVFTLTRSLGVFGGSKTIPDGNLSQTQEYFDDVQPVQQNQFSQIYSDNVNFSFSEIETKDQQTGTVEMQVTYPDIGPILESAIQESISSGADYEVLMNTTAEKMKASMGKEEYKKSAAVTAEVVKTDGQWKIKSNDEIQTILSGNLTEALSNFLKNKKWGDIHE